MLSLKFIRENIDIVKKSISAKNIKFDIDLLIKDDEKRRDIRNSNQNFIELYEI